MLPAAASAKLERGRFSPKTPSIRRLPVSLFAVLLVTDLFHPIDNPPVKSFLNCDVCHSSSRTGTMPMFLFGLEPDDIARPDFFDGAAPFPHPADTGRDDKCLAQRVGMPRCPRAGLESNARTASTRGIERFKQGID